MRKRWFWALALLCGTALAVSLAWMAGPVLQAREGQPQAARQSAPYLLRDGYN